MQIEDIKDEKSLLVWLKTWNDARLSVAIASRAALRVQPRFWKMLVSGHLDGDFINLFRANLVSAVATEKQSPNVAECAGQAARAADSVSFRATTRFEIIAHSVQCAVSAAKAARQMGKNPALYTADTVALSAREEDEAALRSSIGYVGARAEAWKYDGNAEFASAAVWEEVRGDCLALECGLAVWERPLWSNAQPQKRDWQLARAVLRDAGEPLATFATIYNEFWEGREPDWAYLEQIVLVNPEFWEAGPKAVADAIARIDAEFAGVRYTIKETPYAAQVLLDPATGKPDFYPIPDADTADLAYAEKLALRAVQSFLDACERNASSNVLAEIKPKILSDLEDLRTELREDSGFALGVHLTIKNGLEGMRRVLHEAGLLGEEAFVRLDRRLEQAEVLALNASEEAQRSVVRMSETLHSRLSEDRQLELDEAEYELALLSNDRLRRKLETGRRVRQDSEANEYARAEARYRQHALTSRAALSIRERRVATKVDAPGLVDSLENATKVDEGIGTLLKWASKVFALFSTGGMS